jgi:hypothetical protein
MAEIKSSLEIAMERAAAIGGGGREEIDRDEGDKRGKAAARKLLLGELDTSALSDEISSLSGEGLSAARLAAAQILLEAVPHIPDRALAGLGALVDQEVGQGDKAELVRRLAGAVMAIQEADLALAQEVAEDMTKELAEAGISGSAVTANPAAHPGYEERRQAALNEDFVQYNAAVRELAEALGLA